MEGRFLQALGKGLPAEAGLPLAEKRLVIFESCLFSSRLMLLHKISENIFGVKMHTLWRCLLVRIYSYTRKHNFHLT